MPLCKLLSKRKIIIYVKRKIYLHEKKIYFHENKSKGGAFNGKGGRKLHIKNSKTGTLKSPN